MQAHLDQSQAAAVRPVSDEDGFKRFDSYPWTGDRAFLQGVMVTLDPAKVNPQPADGFHRQRALSTCLQARIWWYKSRFNLEVDRLAYEAYSVANPSSSPDARILARLEEILQRMGGASGGTSSASSASSAAPATHNIPAWQLNAPKVDLSKKADDAGAHNNAADGTPYPENFQAIVDAVTLGKPIPGIKEIPDTVIRPPGVTPFGKMKAPRKPWEKDTPPDTTGLSSVFGDVLDKEFPPLPDEQGAGGTGGGGATAPTVSGH